jgi:hypothetical protein
MASERNVFLSFSSTLLRIDKVDTPVAQCAWLRETQILAFYDVSNKTLII